jgi:hypothetical protein
MDSNLLVYYLGGGLSTNYIILEMMKFLNNFFFVKENEELLEYPRSFLSFFFSFFLSQPTDIQSGVHS